MSVDYPRAWEIARAVKPASHHPQCSFRLSEGGFLCDCDVLTQHPESAEGEDHYKPKEEQSHEGGTSF